MSFYENDAKDFWVEALERNSIDDWPDGHCPDAIESTLVCFVEGLEKILEEGDEYLRSGFGWNPASRMSEAWSISSESALEISDAIKPMAQVITRAAYSRMDCLVELYEDLSELDLEGCFDVRREINEAYELEDGDTLKNRKASFWTLIAANEILRAEGLSSDSDWFYQRITRVEIVSKAKLLKWRKLDIPPRSASYLDRAISCFLGDLGLDLIAIMCRAALDSAIEEAIGEESLIERYGNDANNPYKRVSFGLKYVKETGILHGEELDALYRIRRIGNDVVHYRPSVDSHIRTTESKLAEPIVIPPEELEELHANEVKEKGENARTLEELEQSEVMMKSMMRALVLMAAQPYEGWNDLISPTVSIVGSIASGAGYNQGNN